MELGIEEKRLFERFQARFPIKYKHSRGDFGTEVFLEDASAQGARITSKMRMYINDSVSLLVKLTDGFEPLVLNGRVVWIKSRSQDLWELGVEFHKVDFMKMQRLYKLLNSVE